LHRSQPGFIELGQYCRATGDLLSDGPYTDPALNLAFDAKFGGDAGGIAVNGKSVFNGALGIGTGTTTPSSLLDVRGTLTVQNPPNEPSNDIVIKRPGALSASSVEFVLNERENNTTLFIYGYNGSTYKNFVEFDYLDFKTMFPGNGSTLVIDEANNLVGVGTATPGQMLDVVGNIRTNSALITPVLRPA